VLPLRDLNPTRRVPVLTLLLIVANVAIFLLWQPGPFHDLVPSDRETGEQARFLYEHAVVPCEVTHAKPLSPALDADCSGTLIGPSSGPAAGARDSEPFFPGKNVALSVLASLFLHANWLHLLGNMWFLWVFGDNVEDRLGRVRYLALYLVGGVLATLGHVALSPDSVVPLIGASGAIAAVLGAYLVLYPRARIIAIVPPIPIPFVVSAAVLLAVWFVMQFFTNPGSGVAWAAHVTGFVFGILVTLAVRRSSRPPAWSPG
jgi:membrane associated rhomboid family serine protease